MDESQRERAAEPSDEQLEISVSSLRPGSSTPATKPPRSRSRAWYRHIGTAALATLLLAGVVAWLYPRLPRPLPVLDSLSLNTNSAGIQCVDAAAWSPDSARFAIVGSGGCVGAPPEQRTGTLLIYDTATGRRISTTHLDAAVMAQLASAGAQPTSAPIRYSQALWSHDGRTIVITFNMYPVQRVNNQTVEDLFYQGLVVFTISSGREHVLLISFDQIVVNGSDNEYIAERWDLARGTVDTIAVPQSLAYRWTKDGHLAASDLLPGTPAPAPRGGPIGNPIGGASFTIWQSGVVSYSAANCQLYQGEGSSGVGPGPVAYSPDDYYGLNLYTPVWSPDGRYLLQEAGTQGRLPVVPPPPSQPVATPTLSDVPQARFCVTSGPPS